MVQNSRSNVVRPTRNLLGKLQHDRGGHTKPCGRYRMCGCTGLILPALGIDTYHVSMFWKRPKAPCARQLNTLCNLHYIGVRCAPCNHSRFLANKKCPHAAVCGATSKWCTASVFCNRPKAFGGVAYPAMDSTATCSQLIRKDVHRRV